MLITKIEIQKKNKNRVNVYCDNQYAFSLSKNGVVDYSLYKDKTISDIEIQEILQKDNYNFGMNVAMNYLGYGLKTNKEVEDKLKKYLDDNTSIQKILIKMQEYGYINDAEYIKTYIKDRAIPNGWGKKKIIFNLMKKGVNKDEIEEILSSFSNLEENINDNIENLIIKKYKSLPDKYTKYQKKQKILSYLISKGYSYQDIEIQISNFFQNLD